MLLQIFAGIARKFPNARLIRVGGGLSPEHWRVAGVLGIKDRVVIMPFLDRKVLASVYRRAADRLAAVGRGRFRPAISRGDGLRASRRRQRLAGAA